MKLKISKLDAAKRQIEIAIRLYFQDDDPVSIHTLSAAAYNILRDLSKNADVEPMMIKQLFASYIIPGKEKVFIRKVNEAENFFKHADKDQDIALDFDPTLPEFFLLDVVGQYFKLAGKDTPLFKIFRTWFFISHPDLFNFPEEFTQRLLRVAPQVLATA